MFHRFYCYAQHHRESTHTSYLDQILNEHFNHPACGRRRLDYLPSKLSIIGGHVSVVNAFAKINFFATCCRRREQEILHPIRLLSMCSEELICPDQSNWRVNAWKVALINANQAKYACMEMLVRTLYVLWCMSWCGLFKLAVGCDYSSHSADNLLVPSAALATGSDM